MKPIKNPKYPVIDAPAFTLKQLAQVMPDWQAKHRELCASADFETQFYPLCGHIFARFQLLGAAAMTGAAGYEALVRSAAIFCSAVDQTFLIHPEAQASLAKELNAWPTNLSYHPETRKLAVLRVTKLPLSTDHQPNIPEWHTFCLKHVPTIPFNDDVSSVASDIVARFEILRADAAGGNAECFKALVLFAVSFCSALDLFSPVYIKKRSSLAKKLRAWPALISSRNDQRERTMLDIEQLPLAEDLALSTYGRPVEKTPGFTRQRRKKPYSLGTIPNHVIEAEFLRLKLADPVRYNLAKEQVTKSVLDEWFKTIWANLRRSGALKNDAGLRSLGKAYAQTKKDTYPVGTRSYEANLREGVRQRLRTAMDAIFRPT